MASRDMAVPRVPLGAHVEDGLQQDADVVFDSPEDRVASQFYAQLVLQFLVLLEFSLRGFVVGYDATSPP